MTNCPGCGDDWPDDRFNGVSAFCFRCRARSLEFSYGPRQKQGFHDYTIKEFNDSQIAQARANGLDPQPVATKATAVPNASQFSRLKNALERPKNGS